MTIVHTSEHTEGQIFIPEINRLMMVVCICLVVAFRSSSGLAGAYGVAVTANMALTTIVYYFVATRTWNWPAWKALSPVALFLIFDLTYFGANLFKIYDGGWFPMAVAVCVVVVMTAWKDGRAALALQFRKTSMPLVDFLNNISAHGVCRVPGTAVFLASSSSFAPPSLLHHFKHNKVLHAELILLTIVSEETPTVPESARVSVEELGAGMHRLTARYGYMETPNVPDLMKIVFREGLLPRIEPISYYVGRETLLPTGDSKMMRWRKKLFALLSRNSQTATNYFGLPAGQVIELGVQVEL